mgnify:CR=1 FL=1
MPSIGAVDNTASLAKNALRSKLVGVALQSTEFRTSLDEAAAEIRSVARLTATEATIEGCFERVVYALLRDIGLKFHPDKEEGIELRRHLTRGRMDSRLGALVIEYKRPSLLRAPAQTAAAVAQLENYLIALSTESESPFVGILTNGLVSYEIHAERGEITRRTAEERVDGRFLLNLTRLFISLALTALTSRNLIRDFCGSGTDGVLFNTARVLDGILAKSAKQKTEMLRLEWEEMFRLAHDDQSQQRRIEERRASLATLFQIEIPDPATEYRTLFALHTAYAILLKFIAYHVVYDIHFGTGKSQDYRSLAGTSSASLRSFCSNLEDGEVFRNLGMLNILEGDFFSWYCDQGQWNAALAGAIAEMLSNLARYEEARNLFDQKEVPDLFRELYQAAVPRAVRSSFGEFYTPYWLAEHVLDSSSPTENWRVLDPCCGSGTFVIAAIARLRRECGGMTAEALLSEILARVAAIDLNPLGVLTTRIHYFIHISNLVDGSTSDLIIPVYLGDAAALPEHLSLDGVDCLRYTLKTLKTSITATLPISMVSDTPKFMRQMHDYEQCIKAEDASGANEILGGGVPVDERGPRITQAIQSLTAELVHLEKNGWDGIWARILSNFLTTACLGRFSCVIGNPPWIDWRNLPAGYRERIKSMCIDRGLFSGAGRTGGINLNVCALIAHVSINNWLDDTGKLAFLMPRELANQASYEGWRRLGTKDWRFLEFHDWTRAGHPFDPVKEDFMTFVIGKNPIEPRTVPVRHFRKRKDCKTAASSWRNSEEAFACLDVESGVAGQIIPGSTAFAFAANAKELSEFAAVAGNCEYVSRQGVEFYPQELWLFHHDSPGPKAGTVWLRNVQVARSKYKIPDQRVLLETKYLLPLVKGASIGTFAYENDDLIVAFPYEANEPLKPIPSARLKQESPLLLAYFNRVREILAKQTKANDRVRGEDPGEFYGLPRTGPYSFGATYVTFRDNTKWCATVVTSTKVPWGGSSRFVFQKHAVSICERPGGGFISKDEAHFICAILNTPIVARFVVACSDERSFNIRPPIYVPVFNRKDEAHRRLVSASKKAHKTPTTRDAQLAIISKAYAKICQQRKQEMLTLAPPERLGGGTR